MTMFGRFLCPLLSAPFSALLSAPLFAPFAALSPALSPALLLGASLLAAAPAPVFAQVKADGGVRTELRFAPGASSLRIEGAVVRAERDRFFLDARRGQLLSVDIGSLEDNAVFEVYLPGASDRDPLDIRGKALGEGGELTTLHAVLPQNGRYLIVVGGTRGNASYTLTVQVTSPHAAPGGKAPPPLN